MATLDLDCVYVCTLHNKLTRIGMNVNNTVQRIYQIIIQAFPFVLPTRIYYLCVHLACFVKEFISFCHQLHFYVEEQMSLAIATSCWV